MATIRYGLFAVVSLAVVMVWPWTVRSKVGKMVSKRGRHLTKQQGINGGLAPDETFRATGAKHRTLVPLMGKASTAKIQVELFIAVSLRRALLVSRTSERQHAAAIRQRTKTTPVDEHERNGNEQVGRTFRRIRRRKI